MPSGCRIFDGLGRGSFTTLLGDRRFLFFWEHSAESRNGKGKSCPRFGIGVNGWVSFLWIWGHVFVWVGKGNEVMFNDCVIYPNRHGGWNLLCHDSAASG